MLCNDIHFPEPHKTGTIPDNSGNSRTVGSYPQGFYAQGANIILYCSPQCHQTFREVKRSLPCSPSRPPPPPRPPWRSPYWMMRWWRLAQSSSLCPSPALRLESLWLVVTLPTSPSTTMTVSRYVTLSIANHCKTSYKQSYSSTTHFSGKHKAGPTPGNFVSSTKVAATSKVLVWCGQATSCHK